MKIRIATHEDILALDAFVLRMKAAKVVEYFALQMEAQAAGKRAVLLAEEEGELVGYCVLNWHPKYAFFKTMGFPEIQDLNVVSSHRKKGYASAMIARCEEMAAEKGCTHMGIGVGMDASFGAAQRLYVKLGYIPDGHGITYDRAQVAAGEFRPIDNELCLMMVKAL